MSNTPRKRPRRVNSILRLARIQCWLTTYEVSAFLGCHQSTYTGWECRQTPCGRTDHQADLSQLLKLPTASLFGRDSMALLWEGKLPAGFPTTVKGSRPNFPPLNFERREPLDTTRTLLVATLQDFDRGHFDLCLENLELIAGRLKRTLEPKVWAGSRTSCLLTQPSGAQSLGF